MAQPSGQRRAKAGPPFVADGEPFGGGSTARTVLTVGALAALVASGVAAGVVSIAGLLLN